MSARDGLLLLALLALSATCTPAVPPAQPPPAKPVAAEAAPLPPKVEPVPVAEDPPPQPAPILEGPVKMAAPPFTYTLFEPAKVQSSGRAMTLVRLSATSNAITDVAEWFDRNKLALPGVTAKLPADVPNRVGPALLAKAIAQADGHIILFYRINGLTRIAAIVDPQNRLVEMFDFEAFAGPPASVVPSVGLYVTQDLYWAAYEQGVLYVGHHHMTYSKSSGGLNGFISAVDVARKKLLWRSASLVANSENFVLMDGHIITGYGFSEEPDFLYVLEQATGKVEQKVPVHSQAEYLVLRDGKLYVRTYDTNYVFEPRFSPK